MEAVLKHRESGLISTRLGPREVEEIENLVGMGLFMNTADFLRMAAREKLESIVVKDVRNVTRQKAEKEIIGFLKENRTAYPSDIADELGLDFDLVIGIMKGLAAGGRIRWRS